MNEVVCSVCGKILCDCSKAICICDEINFRHCPVHQEPEEQFIEKTKLAME